MKFQTHYTNHISPFHVVDAVISYVEPNAAFSIRELYQRALNGQMPVLSQHYISSSDDFSSVSESPYVSDPVDASVINKELLHRSFSGSEKHKKDDASKPEVSSSSDGADTKS